MDTKVTKILVCDGSVDGILSAVHYAYHSRYGHNYIKIIEQSKDQSCDTMELFSEYVMIDTDLENAKKVGASIRSKISTSAYEAVFRVALSNYEGRSDVIYRFLILGFHMGKGVMEHLSHPYVSEFLAINRNVSRECHNLLGFVRFKEMENGVLYSIIRPKNHVITLITPHFENRFRTESFLIVDEGRGYASYHKKNEGTIYLQLNQEELEELKQIDSGVETYETLWKVFFHSVSIKERENKELQRNLLPLRYRPNMTEFTE